MNNNNSYLKREAEQLVLAIKEDQIIVAPEGKVEIHIALVNESPSEDYIDLQVKGIPADWITIDTPVVHLAAGEAKQVVLTVQPPAVPQSRVGIYPLDVQAVSQMNPNRSVMVRNTVILAAYESKGRIGVLLDSIYFSISPGSSIDIPILLQNRGEVEDSFRLDVVGLPANWISTNSLLTGLEPSTSQEIVLTINAPRLPEATAGRTPFVIQVISQDFPDQKTEVECILTIGAFSHFSALLEPLQFETGQFGEVIINNEGNTSDTYSLNFQNPANALIFEKAVQVPVAGAQPGTQQVEIAYVEIPQGERFQIAAGESGAYAFRSRIRSRPLLGRRAGYPFTVTAVSAEYRALELAGQVIGGGLIPIWLIPAALIVILLCFLLFFLTFGNAYASANATQTASINQTQVALLGQVDSDGDGLTNAQETTLYKTNPFLADTDGDGLSDGQEVQVYKTDPLKADTDQDGLSDGAEVRMGTNPLLPDTDHDGLLDGQENQTCPRPLDPDSDKDGLPDGSDPNPCDPTNPSLTATAAGSQPTQVASLVPTITSTPVSTLPPALTFTPVPTAISLPTTTLVPTSIPVLTLTPVPPSLQGMMVFASNRDGNSEIYALDLANQSLVRLTTSTAQDMQPALAPDSVQVAYVSNQDGNNEIYLGGIDRRVPLNLTNNPADDEQPAWSPDGNWIAFTTNRDGNQEIYIMRKDGTGLRNLTNNPANDFSATWFSTGGVLGSQDWIAFTSTRDGNQEVYKIRPDGTGLTNLTRNPANDYSPSGFSGGGLLAFVTDRDGNPEIYTMDVNGGAQTNITQNPARDLDPVINSNGNWIAFSTDRDGNLEIYVIRIQGGPAYNLSRNPSQDQQPDW